MKLAIGNWQSAMRPRLSLFLLILLSIGWLGIQVGLSATAANPYQPIVDRNVFGLVPIPVAPPSTPEPPASLPKITPNGMMTIFGKLQVLFKVAVPGQPAGKEQSYVMSEGDRQDDIEVQKIDEKSATITFNNHGTIQTLALVEGKASGGAPVPAAGGGEIPRLPVIPGRPAGGAATPVGFGSHFGHQQNTASSGESPNSAGGGASSGMNGQNQETQLTPEAQVLMIEANRMQAIQNNDPTAKLLPITPITDQVINPDGGSGSGAPTLGGQ